MVFSALKLAFYLPGAVNGPEAELGLMCYGITSNRILEMKKCKLEMNSFVDRVYPVYTGNQALNCTFPDRDLCVRAL